MADTEMQEQDVSSGSEADGPGLVDTKKIEEEPSELEKDQNLSEKHKTISLHNVSLSKEVAAIEEVGGQNSADGKNDNVGIVDQSEKWSGGSGGHEVSNDTKVEPSNPQRGGGSEKKWKTWLLSDSEAGGIDEAGTPEDQESFIREVESFHIEKSLEFRAPKFYKQPLNCLKLWRSVLKLGGYDVVTTYKLWPQVGRFFHPPKTCTTVAWTFRNLYEKALLGYEKYLRKNGELNNLHVSTLIPSSSAEEARHQGSRSGSRQGDSAARAMQGGHAQSPLEYGEGLNSTSKEKNLKSSGLQEQSTGTSMGLPVSHEAGKQVVAEVVDVGPPVDWVKINVMETKDCFELYALIPGLLPGEVQVQSDPAGRLVISGQPEQLDNPWGITPFKVIVALPARIDPHNTSGVLSPHGRWLIRAPFEQSSVLE